VRFPTADAIVDLHAEILAKTGGHAGVLNLGTVESAVERARWGPFPRPPDLFDRAAFLLRGVCQDHPFADGNKRTAFEATDLFLRLNGRRLLAKPAATVAFMLAVAQADLSLEDVAAWLRTHAKDYRATEGMQ
jgi:death-on-curing protein